MNKRINGSISIEAAVGIPILLFIFFLWIEISFLFFAINSTEHAFAKAVFEAKKADLDNNQSVIDYTQIIESKLAEYGGTLWGGTTIQRSISINISYFSDYSSLLQCTDSYQAAQNCPSASSNYEGGTIAIYSLNYIHQPIILSWFPLMSILREITTVQDYERCKFDIYTGGNCV